MDQISEKVDLSKVVLDIDINSPIFDKMKKDLDKAIKNVLMQVYDEKFEAGEVTLKLSIEVPNDFEIFAGRNEFNENVNKEYKYKKPVFEHKVTTTLKKQSESKGAYNEKREIQFVNGKFLAVPVKLAQMSMDDLINQDE